MMWALIVIALGSFQGQGGGAAAAIDTSLHFEKLQTCDTAKARLLQDMAGKTAVFASCVQLKP